MVEQGPAHLLANFLLGQGWSSQKIGWAIGLACGMAHGTYYLSLSSIAAERFHSLHAGQGQSLYLASWAPGMFAGPPDPGRCS